MSTVVLSELENGSFIDINSHMDGSQTHILEVDSQTHIVDNQADQNVNVSDEKQHKGSSKKITVLAICLILVTLAIVIPLTWNLLKKNKESNGSSAKSGFLAKQSASPLTEHEVKQAMTDLVKNEFAEQMAPADTSPVIEELTKMAKQRDSADHCKKSEKIQSEINNRITGDLLCERYLAAALWKKHTPASEARRWSAVTWKPTVDGDGNNVLLLDIQAHIDILSDADNAADSLVKSLGAVAQGLLNTQSRPLKLVVLIGIVVEEGTEISEQVRIFESKLIERAQKNKALDLKDVIM